MDVVGEQYILLLLADGNLPTGSFVASSGLESYVKHGFFAHSPSNGDTERTINFIRDSLGSYSHSALPFVFDAHDVLSAALALEEEGRDDRRFQACRERLVQLDALYDAMTLNHVARRASKAQGVALLTLFSKGFSRPSWLPSEDNHTKRSSTVSALIDDLKLNIRRDVTHGHLPICWGVLTAALGLSGERSQYLHLFLHARGLLSAAIRMNIIGPYAAQQLLLHAVRPLVESQMAQCSHMRTAVLASPARDDPAEEVKGPANTWPLGELLAARHDLQHSRIFNS